MLRSRVFVFSPAESAVPSTIAGPNSGPAEYRIRGGTTMIASGAAIPCASSTYDLVLACDFPSNISICQLSRPKSPAYSHVLGSTRRDYTVRASGTFRRIILAMKRAEVR